MRYISWLVEWFGGRLNGWAVIEWMSRWIVSWMVGWIDEWIKRPTPTCSFSEWVDCNWYECSGTVWCLLDCLNKPNHLDNWHSSAALKYWIRRVINHRSIRTFDFEWPSFILLDNQTILMRCLHLTRSQWSQVEKI